MYFLFLIKHIDKSNDYKDDSQCVSDVHTVKVADKVSIAIFQLWVDENRVQSKGSADVSRAVFSDEPWKAD
ncbi:hypothetical protein J6590_072998 [Homalodisca vitripennis]|nr:hypothetical protein J6590_093548 [Homalodisca vitripennis]KAG8330037.1 hypothetical protein J6590_072998 [Homalodisca vitripennis]